MPDRLTDDVQYLYAHRACPACMQPIDRITDPQVPEDGTYATTIRFICACGYRLRWVCRAACCAHLPPAPDEEDRLCLN